MAQPNVVWHDFHSKVDTTDPSTAARNHSSDKEPTFLIDKLRKSGNKSNDPVRLRCAFLHAQHPTDHVNKHVLKYALSRELDAVSIVHGFCMFRSVYV
jgi:hypothetical protein